MASKRFVLIISLAVAAAALGGCVAETVVRVASPRAVVVVRVAPPPLPIYEQPACPGDGYLWTPGYWAHGAYGYFWVPGTWAQPPRVGLLWTPGFWAAEGAAFTFHEGFWGVRVGFYGGVDYGGGYGGSGYAGGRWVGSEFHYNAAVTNVTNVNSVTVHNIYRETIVNNVTVRTTTVNNVSYSGGAGGVRAQPTSAELAAARLPHVEPTPAQRQHHEDARAMPELQASRNQGHPPIAATARPSAFAAPDATRANGIRGRDAEDGRSLPPAASGRPAEHAAAPATAVAQPAVGSRRALASPARVPAGTDLHKAKAKVKAHPEAHPDEKDPRKNMDRRPESDADRERPH